MQNSCVRLYQRLVPGISNVTIRLRYYGFYAWLADIYAKRIGIPDPIRWKIFLRRSEALYSALCVRATESAGVAGSYYVSEVLRDLTDESVLMLSQIADQKDGERQYLKQAYGAFGAAYGGPLYEVSVLAENREQGVPNPSEQLGDSLAAAFAGPIGAAGNYFFEAVEKGEILVKDLDKLASMSPNRIDPLGEECNSYRRILFASEEFKPSDKSRAVTLTLLLRAAIFLGRPLKNADEFRWLIFDETDFGANKLGLKSDRERSQAKLWGLYHASDLLHDCYEAFLRLLLDQLATSGAGMPASDGISQTVALITSDHPGILQHSWGTLDESEFEAQTDQELLNVVLTSRVRMGRAPDNDAGISALRLLNRLHRRFSEDAEFIAEIFSIEGAAAQTLVSELRFFDDRRMMKIGEILNELIESKVLSRHLWVAMRKLTHQKDYTFLIESDDGLLRCRQLDGPAPTNPRLGPALGFLRDAHLLDENGVTSAAYEFVGVT
jgi:hypothetical protein